MCFIDICPSEKLICSRDLLYADIDNRVAKANQDFNYVIRQSLANGQLMQTLPKKNISIEFNSATSCDSNPYFQGIVANGNADLHIPPGFVDYYKNKNYTLYVVNNENNHTILFEDTGERNKLTDPLTPDGINELFDYANTQIHSNLIGLQESYFRMIKGATRLGVVWGNESFNFIDIYPTVENEKTKPMNLMSCVVLQAASNGFADMYPILVSGRFLEGRINKFYFDTTLQLTLIDYAYPNPFPGYNWTQRFSVSQVTINTYEFLNDNLLPDDNNKDVMYFITDNCTGLIVGMNDKTMKTMLGSDKNVRTANYIQNMKNGFNKIFETFFYHGVNISENCEEYNKDRAKRNGTIIKTDDGEYYYVTYYDSTELVWYLYWAIVKYTQIGGVDSKWSVTPAVMKFIYSLNDTTSTTKVILNNTGSTRIDWIVNHDSSVGVTLSKQQGTLQPKEYVELIATIDVKHRLSSDEPYFLAINPVLDLSTCISSFVLACEYEEVDCQKSDIEVVENSTDGFDIILSYKWKQPRTCHDGIPLPNNIKKSGYALYNASVAAKVIIYIMFAINLIEYLIYLTLILTKPIFTRSISPPIYFIILISGVLIGCIGDILVVNDVHCYAQYAILAACMVTMSSSFFFIVFDIYKKHEKKQFSSSGEWKFVCKVGAVIVVLFGVTMYLGYPFQFDKTVDADGYDFTATVCGSENTIEQIALFIFFLSIVTLILCVHIISFGFSELPMAAKKEIFVAILLSLCSIAQFIFRLLTIGNYPSSSATFALYIIINILAIIIMPIIMPITKFFKRETATTNMDMKNLLFDDPVVRACLKLYLKEVLQEESMLFWEDACKYQMGYVKRSKDENDKLAHKLYSEYIADGSENEINISTSMKLRIKTAIDNKEITPGLYDEAIGEIQHLILTNNSYLFIQSKFGLLSENANMWFSEFNNFDNEIKEAIEDEVSYLLHGTDNKIQFRSTVMHLRKSTTRSSSTLGGSSTASKPVGFGISAATTPATSGTDWRFTPNRGISNMSSQHAPSNPSNHGISIPGTVNNCNISPNDTNLKPPPSLPIKEPNGVLSGEAIEHNSNPTFSSPHEIVEDVQKNE